MVLASKIIQEMCALRDEEQSRHLARFFKTGPGEYGEGDRFLGIKVPVTRTFVKKYKNDVTLEDIDQLINSEWHEIRLAGFLFLVELYRKCIKAQNLDGAGTLVDFYLENIDKGNNWDLVDLVSAYILGDWILIHPKDVKILFELANKEGQLWHQRVAIVSTFALIRNAIFEPTLRLAEQFLTHRHDLIHKATGWMLREVGKRGGKSQLVEFLHKYKSSMPRTMLRYSIEKFTPEERETFMR